MDITTLRSSAEKAKQEAADMAAKAEELEKQAEEIKSQISKLEAEAEVLEKTAADLEAVKEGKLPVATTKTGKKRPGRPKGSKNSATGAKKGRPKGSVSKTNKNGQTWQEVVMSVIQNSKTALTAGEVVQAVIETGFKTNGDYATNVYQALHKLTHNSEIVKDKESKTYRVAA